MSTPELVYEIWHLDDGIPTRLTTREESTDAARVLRREPRSVIVRQGVVIQQRSDVTPAQAKLFREAAAKAWADAGGVAPEPPPVPDANPKPSKRHGPPPPAFGRRARPKEQPLSVPSPADEAPPPVVVVRRKSKPAPEVPAMPATTCPCGKDSGPVNTRTHGRPTVKEFADFCLSHRTMGRARVRGGATPAEARAAILAAMKGDSAPKPTAAAKRPAAKVRPAPAAPLGDLLDVVRRQRAVVDALGGLAAAEAHVVMVGRVGAQQLAAIVEELSR